MKPLSRQTAAHREATLQQSAAKASITLALLAILFLQGCTGLFFHPDRKFGDNPVVAKFSPQDVYFETTDNLTLHGWFFAARGTARATVLVLHGNAENLSTHVNSVLWLVPQGFNIFIFDYRGYGKSEGKPTVQGVHDDAEAALTKLLTLPGVVRDRIIVLGQSLGGAVAVYTVANAKQKERIRALVIEGAFSSYRLIAREKLADFFLTWPLQYPLSWLFNDDYSPVKWIDKVTPVPVLILSGLSDTIVPHHHGQLLFDAASAPKNFWMTIPPGHIQSFADADVRQKLVVYLEGLLPTRQDSP